MRTISLRQFRDNIGDIAEPVEVQRRDKGGNFQVLGRWTPLSGGASPSVYGDLKADAAAFEHDPASGDAIFNQMFVARSRQLERDAILRKINKGG